jgi:oligopeptide/dipeptide ABC transporter ATP-binding protein
VISPPSRSQRDVVALNSRHAVPIAPAHTRSLVPQSPIIQKPPYDVGVTALLELRNLTVELPTQGGWVRPVNDVSLSLAAGETLGLVGESGSGKTMLSLALMGLLPRGARMTGQAWFAGRNGDLEDRRELVALDPAARAALRGRALAMIFQESMTSLNPVMRVGAQVAEAVRVGEGAACSRQQVERRVLEAFERARIPDPELRARQFPHQLSGGLRQRVMIAMAVAGGPRLLIADEPTTALDVTVQEQILELLATLRAELGLALLFITHDLAVVARVAQRIAVLYAGRVVEVGPASEILARPRHPYTEGLLRASPRMKREKLVPIPGAVPRLDALPSGCAFAPRCPYVRAECEQAVPELRRAGPEHLARCILVQETAS